MARFKNLRSGLRFYRDSGKGRQSLSALTKTHLDMPLTKVSGQYASGYGYYNHHTAKLDKGTRDKLAKLGVTNLGQFVKWLTDGNRLPSHSSMCSNGVNYINTLSAAINKAVPDLVAQYSYPHYVEFLGQNFETTKELKAQVAKFTKAETEAVEAALRNPANTVLTDAISSASLMANKREVEAIERKRAELLAEAKKLEAKAAKLSTTTTHSTVDAR